MKFRILLFIVCLILTSCQERKTYENTNGACVLKLYSDGTYKYKTPLFFGSSHESGKFKIIQDTLILETKNHNNKDSVINIEYFCGYDTPSVLKIRTTNCYNNKVETIFTINSSNKVFSTNVNGEFYLNYNQLEKDGIIKKGQNIDIFNIYFNGKLYKIDMKKDYSNSSKPEELVFRLNDYSGEEFRPLIRKYKIKNDTIIINDIQRKLIGINNIKMYKK